MSSTKNNQNLTQQVLTTESAPISSVGSQAPWSPAYPVAAPTRPINVSQIDERKMVLDIASLQHAVAELQQKMAEISNGTGIRSGG